MVRRRTKKSDFFNFQHHNVYTVIHYINFDQIIINVFNILLIGKNKALFFRIFGQMIDIADFQHTF